jgi:hypothetical protein
MVIVSFYPIAMILEEILLASFFPPREGVSDI